jgi:hypothetical protein
MKDDREKDTGTFLQECAVPGSVENQQQIIRDGEQSDPYRYGREHESHEDQMRAGVPGKRNNSLRSGL